MSDIIDYEVATPILSTRKHHVQIRVDENGPKKSDGRKGRILIEDPDAPYEIVKWLRSDKCKRAGSGTGKRALVWIDGEFLGDGTLDPNDLDDTPPPALPAVRGSDLELAASMLPHLRVQLVAVQSDITAARAARDAEIVECDKQIAAARLRVSEALKTETEELEALAERRRANSAERSAMAQDLKADTETFTEVRRNITKYNSQGAIESVVDGITKIATGINGTPLEGMAQAFTALLLKKAGVNIPTE